MSLPSRTTLIGEAAVGWKRFDAGVLSVAIPTPVIGIQTSTAPQQGTGSQAAMGPGSMGQGPSSAVGQRGPAGQLTTLLVTPVATSSPGSARQITVFGRVAQSLADRLALTFDVSWRNAGGAVAPAIVATPEMMIDDGVYDDPYASDATVLRAGVKRVFEAGRELEAGVSRWSKYYENTPAFDIDGAAFAGLMREDDIWRFEASWRESLLPSRTGNVGLALLTTYTFMDSSSTDAFYDYRSHRARVLLAISY